MSDFYIFICPHCTGEILVHNNELNCRIFRHAVLKNGNQINPHAPKEECERLIKNNEIYGCGKPFQVIGDKAVECDYL
jgi:hypothetical protein